MSGGFSDSSIGEITAVLEAYFDGLYNGDVDAFGRIFHENAHLYASDGNELTDWSREHYFEIIKNRQSAREQGLKRYDRILSIHKAGPDTALATVNCAMPPKFFTDYLTLLRMDGEWQIISKTFHIEIHE